jgi:hypothetical protein
MTTGPRPPINDEDLSWDGPVRRGAPNKDVDTTLDDLLADLGAGQTVYFEAQRLAPSNGGLYDVLFYENGVATRQALATLPDVDTDPCAWTAEALTRRAWALRRALRARSAIPSYDNPAGLVENCPAAVGEAVTSVLTAATCPDATDLLNKASDVEVDTLLMVLVSYVDSLIDDLSAALDDNWDRTAVWNMVFPGSPVRGMDRPEWPGN